jgi:CubicO group peptidase (beta-lactamase class C family)
VSAANKAVALVDDARERASGVAVAVIDGTDDAVHLDSGAHPLTETTRFDIGSVTKTFTALLLAQMVVAGDVELDAPAAREITFLELVDHTSGLPRVPENLMPKAMRSPEDPWRDYTADDLTEALAAVELTPGPRVYSNFGYMVLAAALAEAGGSPYRELLATRVLEPLGLTDTGFGWRGAVDRVPGHVDNRPVPDWTLHVPGPGGITSTIGDIARYLRAHLDPGSTRLHAPLDLVQRPLCWGAEGSVLWHNGGAGGFGAMVAFDRTEDRGAAMLTNCRHTDTMDRLVLRAVLSG